MSKRLIITEKPSVAMDFVKALSSDRAFVKHNGYYENSIYAISWAYGHLVELKSPEEYSPDLKRWARKTLPIIPDHFAYKIIRGKGKQFNVIKKLIHRKDIAGIINAGDPGREGELLQRLIYEQAGNRKLVQRFWTSNALSVSTIRSAMKALRPSNEFDNLYNAALARQHSDWLIGMSGTRALSIALGDLYSIGRVQTCILALIVSRQKEISSFKPQDYWLVFADTNKNIRFNWVSCDHNNCDNKIKSKSHADEIVSLLTGQTAVVQKVTNADKAINAPKLFSLTTLQQEANRIFGLSAQETLNIAQSLYEKHCTSYPRTESQYLDETPGTKANCEKIINFISSRYPTDRTNLNVGKKVFDKSKLTDHHALIPQMPDRQTNLSANEQKILNLITRRFIAAFYPAYKYTQTTVFAEANGQMLIAVGKVVTDSGWKEVYNFFKQEKDNFLPVVAKGELLQLIKIISEMKQTKPPANYNEAKLLNAMTNANQFVSDKQLKHILKENAGIGTPATRAQIIEVLLKRKYVLRKKKMLIPTEKGIFLIDSLNGSKITKPDYTALWEQRLEEIVQGKETREQFMQDIIAYLNDLVKFSDTLKLSLPAGSSAKAGKKATKGDRNMDTNVLGKCPECKGDVVESKKAYGCSNWRSEDGGCRFVIWKTIAKKVITEAQAKKIIAGEKVPVKGLTSRAGKKFGAYLKYDKDQRKVVFDGFIDDR